MVYFFVVEHHSERTFEKVQKPSSSKTYEDPDESMEEAETV